MKNHRELPSQTIEESYNRYIDMVYRMAFSYMKNKADTEDITADVFIKLMKKGLVFQSAEHEKAWLLRVTGNTSKDALKHWWRKNTDIDLCENLQAEESLHMDETLQAVLALPPRCKSAVYLYYYEGYSSKEVAAILQKPHSTIRNHLQEGRTLLKGVLEHEE